MASERLEAFNSLFEMPRKERVRRAAEEALELSILYLRCLPTSVRTAQTVGDTFNSLFEMLVVSERLPHYERDDLSILYLRCDCIRSFTHSFGIWRTFNSLFEMLLRATGLRRSWSSTRLSILYLRCVPHRRVCWLGGEHNSLSILYLRCSSGSSCDERRRVGRFQFSI